MKIYYFENVIKGSLVAFDGNFDIAKKVKKIARGTLGFGSNLSDSYSLCKPYNGTKSFRRNNCNYLFISIKRVYILLKKKQFLKYEGVFLTFHALLTWLPYLLILFFFRRIEVIGLIRFEDQSGTWIWLKFRGKNKQANRVFSFDKEYVLHTLSSEFSGRYVCLNSLEDIKNRNDGSDIDLLVDSRSVDELSKLLQRKPGTYAVDLISTSNFNKYGFNGIPYYPLPLLTRCLNDAKFDPNLGIYFLNDINRLLTSAYKFIFISGKRASERQKKNIFELSVKLGIPVDLSFSGVRNLFVENHLSIPLDLLGFISSRNLSLVSYLKENTILKPGLISFFLRDFGQDLESSRNALKKSLCTGFELIVELDLKDISQEQLSQIRGGNWLVGKGDFAEAMPVYWFLVFDRSPSKPSSKQLRRVPLLDNRNSLIKDSLRADSGGLRLIHSSDNSDEAYSHFCTLLPLIENKNDFLASKNNLDSIIEILKC